MGTFSFGIVHGIVTASKPLIWTVTSFLNDSLQILLLPAVCFLSSFLWKKGGSEIRSETEKARGWCTALSWLDQEPHDCSNTVLLCILWNESAAQRSIESLRYSWVITLPTRHQQSHANLPWTRQWSLKLKLASVNPPKWTPLTQFWFSFHLSWW